MKYLYIHIFLLFAFTTKAQQRSFTPINAKGETEKRLALVIGNANYQGNVLTNPLNDAKAMRTALQELGFTVQYYENLKKTDMEAALMRFSSDLHKHNVGLFYFAGHGFEGKDKVNYLMSTDMNSSVNEALAKDKSLNLDVVMQSMQDANANSNLLVIDACRNNPFRSWSRDGAKGLGSVNPVLGTVVFFAASAGQPADDNRGGKNGLFTEELLSQIRKPNLELSDILKNTSRGVYKRSGGQMPAISGNLLEDFYFIKTEIAEPVKPKNDQLFMPMAFIKGGTFQMGDTRDEGESDEKPVHQVTVSDFWMGKYEVTQKQWKSIVSSNPSYFDDCENCPVEFVDYNSVQFFLKELNTRTGGNYRLPTEAEWEYAAGGGAENRSRFGNGSDIADPTEINFNGGELYKMPYSKVGEAKLGRTIAVGSFKPNRLGLYDMTGNVLEWCGDWYGANYYELSSKTNPSGPISGDRRVIRGGSWDYEPKNSRITKRIRFDPIYGLPKLGFRVVSSQ